MFYLVQLLDTGTNISRILPAVIENTLLQKTGRLHIRLN